MRRSNPATARFPIRRIVILILLLGSALSLRAQSFTLADDGLYNYRVQVYGVWGPQNAELPPLGVRLNFAARTVDFPCCPSAAFHQPGRSAPAPSAGQSLRGYTWRPAEANIELLAPVTSIDFFRPAQHGVAFGSEHISALRIARLQPPAHTPDDDQKRWHMLRFQVRPDFTVALQHAQFQDTGFGNPQYPTNFQELSTDDTLRREGFAAVNGTLLLPAGLPRSGVEMPADGKPLFYQPKPGWHSHYDLVVSTKNQSQTVYAPLRAMTFFQNNIAERTTIFFRSYLNFKTSETAALETFAGEADFNFRRKAWGALHSRASDICVLRECLLQNLRRPDKEVELEDVRPGPGRITPGRRPPIRIQDNRIINKPQNLFARDRLFQVTLDSSNRTIQAPARVAVRLKAAAGSDLNGVTLQFNAVRKSDNRVSRATAQTGIWNRDLATSYRADVDGPTFSGNRVAGFNTVEESRYLVQFDDIPTTEYIFTCTVLYRSTGYNCTAGRPNEFIVRISRILPPVAGGNSQRSQDLRNFEEAFGSYRVGLPYTEANAYDMMADAYPLFEIEFKKP